MSLPSQVLSYCYRKKGFILTIGILVIIFCEIYLRLPFLPQQLEYEPDNELGALFRPSQEGYMWLGNMSYKSPLITINSDGHRGKETDWSKPLILAVGNSDAFGGGVKDDETWASYLEKAIHQDQGMDGVQVVNASHPGHGPYHHYVRISRVLTKHQIRAIILRVDVADRYFRYIPREELEQRIKMAQLRKTIRQYTKGIPYLINKLEAQWISIKSSLRLKISSNRRSSASAAIVGVRMYDENHSWWEAIQTLSEEKGIPLILMIYDMNGTDAAGILKERLRSIVTKYENIYILRLGPQQFGLNEQKDNHSPEKIMKDLVLKRDPHASPLQHQLIANSVLKFLIKQDLMVRINRKAQKVYD